MSTRSVVRPIPVGDAPLYVEAGRGVVISSSSGLSTYRPLPTPQPQPQFAAPAFDPAKSSSLSVMDLSAANAIADPATLAMDPAPDGTQIVGGAAPGAITLSKDGRLAYVALSNVDRVAVVSLSGVPRVVRGLDLRLYPGAPYGAQPSAEALSPDGKRLFVALAGLNSVAVLDAKRTTRYRFGLIPTAWYPSAIALSNNGRYLYVASAKGVDGWGVLQRVDLKHTSLVKATLSALRYNRTPSVAKLDPVIPPLRSNKRSDVIDHVVYIAVGDRTLRRDARRSQGRCGQRARQRRRGAEPLSGEHDAEPARVGAKRTRWRTTFMQPTPTQTSPRQVATASDATLYQQLVDAAGAARSPLQDHGDDPEDYGRAGYLFNAMARAGLTYRDYGGLMRLSGYDGSLYHSTFRRWGRSPETSISTIPVIIPR